MNKRIFTHKVDFNQKTVAAGTSLTYNADNAWLMQEDIDVIGVEIQIDMTNHVGNDGMGLAVIEVSQSGKYGEDGLIARVNGISEWNTAPAFGGARQPNQVVVMFPAGHAIPVKQEGHIYTNGYYNAVTLTAGNLTFAGTAIIYYTKKGG